jgi:hypothetical protein
MSHNCIGLFCEDIREEVGGPYTIVGVMPDNINVAGPAGAESGLPLMLPKMGIYLRVNLDASKRPKGAVTARATIPGLDDVQIGELGEVAIKAAYVDSKAKKQSVVGLIFKAILSPVQFKQSGLAVIYVKIDGAEIIAGILNVELVK